MRGGSVTVFGALVATACAGATNMPSPHGPQPATDPSELAVQATERTRPSSPVMLTFGWRAREPDFRGSGVGVARIEPPYRARIDLFLENGETAAIAALVEDHLSIPPSLPYALVPRAPLLWAALGVFRPGSDAHLVHGTNTDGAPTLTYQLTDGGRVRFRLRPDGSLAEAALLDDGGSAVQRVSLSGQAAGQAQGGFPERATYRDLSEYRELSMTLESLEEVDSFPMEIWTPSRPGAHP